MAENAGIDWARWLRPGDHIVCSHLTSEPVALLQSLAACEALPSPLILNLGTPQTMAALDLPAGCQLVTLGGMGSGGSLAAKRPVQMSTLPYSRAGTVFQEGTARCDVALVGLARDENGRLYLGAAHGAVVAAARIARHVIAQVSPQAPCVLGGQWPDDIPLTAILETAQAPPVTLSEGLPGAVEQAIARHVVDLVPEGACLQVGIGTLPSAVLSQLTAHRHLGIHSGMISDSLYALVTCGAADHSRKRLDPGVAVTGSVMGTLDLYRACHRNPSVQLREPAYTHAAAVIAAQPDFFSLNSALEIDLLGNVNAETVPGVDGRWRYVGGIGGLADFMRGAIQAPRGQSVLALASRTPRGRARIVARLSGPCTVAAIDTDRVVTEHGVARLRAANVDARVRQMLAVANPQDRPALTEDARALGLI